MFGKEDADAVFQKLQTVVTQFLKGNIRYLGMIPQDSQLEKAVRQQKTVSLAYPDANATRAFEVLAGNLLNHEQNEVPIRRSFVQMLAGLVGKR